MRDYKFIICLHLINIVFIFFDYISCKGGVYISHFVIKGHRAALKEFKVDPLERVITVSKEGDIKCRKYEEWLEFMETDSYASSYLQRVDLRARLYYKVSSKQLTESMVKNTAIKILKGEL